MKSWLHLCNLWSRMSHLCNRSQVQDKLLQHDMWGKPSLPSNIFAQRQADASKLEAGAAHYTFDVVL